MSKGRLAALRLLLPVVLAYVLSFAYVGGAWPSALYRG